MKVISVVYNDIAILPHFLRHYSALGVSQFIFGVYRDAGMGGQLPEILKGYNVITYLIAGDFNSDKDVCFAFDICETHISPNEWWIVADIDEFHEYPFSLSATVAQLDAQSALYLCSNLVERITDNGACPPIEYDRPLWEQFPAAAALGRLTKTARSKVMLVKGRRRYCGGHHRADHKFRNRVKWKGRVHHFKWHSRAIERLKIQIEDVKRQGWGHHKTLLNLLEFWNRHKRMPISGELGFWHPRKPEMWPD